MNIDEYSLFSFRILLQMFMDFRKHACSLHFFPHLRDICRAPLIPRKPGTLELEYTKRHKYIPPVGPVAVNTQHLQCPAASQLVGASRLHIAIEDDR